MLKYFSTHYNFKTEENAITAHYQEICMQPHMHVFKQMTV
jgi:hypothetical protein